MLLRPFLAALLVALVAPLYAADDQPVKKAVFEKFSAPRLERLMKNLKIRFKEVEGKTDTYTFEYEKRTIVLFNQNSVLEACVYYKDGDQVTSSRINEWNRKWRFTKVYLGEDKSLVLESDLCLTGGVTEDAVTAWMQRFVGSFKEFDKHFGD